MKKIISILPLMATMTVAGILLRSDFCMLLIWWGAIAVSGLVFMPLTFRLFPSFLDKGYLFSKTLGLVIPAYVLWLLSSFRIVPFERLGIVLLYGISGLLLYRVFKGRYEVAAICKDTTWLNRVLWEEAGFFLCLTLFTFLRGLRPDLNGLGGTEKLMDFGIVNSLLHTRFMPPADIWFAGSPVNYYYFGHYITAFLAKLTAVSPASAYNLMMGTLFAFAFMLTFSLATAILCQFRREWATRAIIAGLLAASLLTMGGNLHPFVFSTVFPAAKAMGVLSPEIQIKQPYSFIDATRYIGYNPPRDDKTIHEFPAYSFIVSDLHAHVLNIPFVLTVLALLFSLLCEAWLSGKTEPVNGWWKHPPPQWIGVAFLIGVFRMSNYWDFPIYTVIALSVLLYVEFSASGYTFEALWRTAVAGGILYSLSAVVALPFTLKLEPLMGGIGITHSHTLLHQLLVLWASSLFLAAYFIWFILFREGKTSKKGKKLALKEMQSLQQGQPGSENKKPFQIRLLALHPSDAFVLILCLSAMGLVLLPELIYVKDIYGAAYYRANTMFKLTYQAFILLALSSGVIACRVLSVKRPRWRRNLLGTAVLSAVLLPLIFPFCAVGVWYGELDTARYKGLEGDKAYFERYWPGDWGAVQWLKTHAQGQPVILEAYGTSYTDESRISALTGFPTVLGWLTHEKLWRNGAGPGDERKVEIHAVYEAQEAQSAKVVLERYGVSYIIVGDMERARFPKLNERVLTEQGSVVYDHEGTKIIRVKQEQP